MLKKIKILYLIIIVCLLLIIQNSWAIFYSFQLIPVFISLLFNDYNVLNNILSAPLMDVLFSEAMLILLPVFLLLKRKQLKFLHSECNLLLVILILAAAVLVFTPLIAPHNPDYQNDLKMTKLLPPFTSVQVLEIKKTEYDDSYIGRTIKLKDRILKIPADNLNAKTKIFVLGTDEYGRDILSRIIYGMRISLLIACSSVIISICIGVFLGFISAFLGGFIDSLLNRLTDMFLVFPVIFLLILILSFWGNNFLAVIIVLGFSGWMSLYKIIRTEVISLKQKEFIITAYQIGLPKWRILLKEILPHILIPLVVNAIFLFGNVILAEAALSYLGLGIGNTYPSLGSMVQEGQTYIFNSFWLMLFPGIFLILIVLFFNFLGRTLNEYFNPLLKRID